jgi:hypothetical protein
MSKLNGQKFIAKVTYFKYFMPSHSATTQSRKQKKTAVPQ